MAYYANFNPAKTPSPVIGWYDTSFLEYRLPPAEALLELTAEQWDARLSGSWAVQDGALVQIAAPAQAGKA